MEGSAILEEVFNDGFGSSDEEDNKYFELSKYNTCGKSIKDVLKHKSQNVTSSLMVDSGSTKNLKKWVDSSAVTQKLNNELQKLNENNVESHKFGAVKGNVLVDPVLFMHVINPLVSSETLKARMYGRVAISTLKIKNFIQALDSKESDWVTGGVIISKMMKTSQNGNQYCIWNVSDLHGDIKTICVFLFGSAYKEFWKTAIGTVVGILNPALMDNKDNRTEATLRVDNSQKIMVFGTSKDFGTCRSKKKNGEDCTSVVNKSKCEYCIYHVKQAYNKASRRSELQSACSGRGLNNLRNKVLGKNEVFYGGKTFTAIPAKKSSKQIQKDEERLKKLSAKSPMTEKFSGSCKDAKLNKDKEILDRLNVGTVPEPVTTASPKIEKMIDLNFSVSKKQRNAAKINALKFVRQNGPLKKEDEKKKIKSPEQINSLKRRLDIEEDGIVNKKIKVSEKTEKDGDELIKEKKKRSGITEEFIKLMNTDTENPSLLKEAENEEREKYFNKLEIREKMEDKMASTFKVECKAVRCLKCNYKSFSASEFCKKENHPLKVVNAMKRFWKCGDCSGRTVCLELVPLHSCKNCGSSKWERTSMMPEKKDPNLVREKLSITGHEETYIGGSLKANLNLLVPDEGS